ncbi:MAG: sugar transferase [Candidatus Colwellbacteria bacterium]|nr:sugar transferase [Candidatus Colwellbacteria bacterium]
MTYLFLKRLIDVVVSIVTIILLAPLFLVIAIFIKLDSPGPVFYAQRRLGYKQKIFKIFKFRTMDKDADQIKVSIEQVRKWEDERSDPRATRIGRWLRRTGIDELPQLLNVLKGDMSFVGPRPYYQLRIDADPSLKERLGIKPGCVSLSLVKGGVHLTDEEIKKIDREYEAKRNLWLDIKILLKFIYLVISGKGF